MNIFSHLHPINALLIFSINLIIHISVVALFTLLLTRTLLRHRPAARHSVVCCTMLYLLFISVLCPCTAGNGKAWITLSLPASLRMPIVRQMAHRAGIVKPFSAPATAKETSGTSSVSMPANADIISRQASETLLPAGFGEVQIRRSSALTVNLRHLVLLLFLIWGGGVVQGFVRLVRSWRQVARLRCGIGPIDERDLEDVLMQVKRAVRSQSLPPIASSQHLSGPLVVGVRRPLVILPEELLNQLNRSQLRDVLIHECAHVALRHPIEGLLQRIAEILFWPHPLVHALGRELAQAREDVCDNFVLEQAEATHYARTLLVIAEGISCPQTVLPLALLPPRLRLEHRVAGLLDPRRNRRTRVVLWQSGAILLVFHLLGTVVTVRASEARTLVAPARWDTRHVRMMRKNGATWTEDWYDKAQIIGSLEPMIAGKINAEFTKTTNEFGRKGIPMYGTPARMKNGVTWPEDWSGWTKDGSGKARIRSFLEHKLARLHWKIAGLRGEIVARRHEIVDKVNEEITKITETNDEIDNINAEISEANDEIDETNDEIANINDETDETNAEIKRDYYKFIGRISTAILKPSGSTLKPPRSTLKPPRPRIDLHDLGIDLHDLATAIPVVGQPVER